MQRSERGPLAGREALYCVLFAVFCMGMAALAACQLISKEAWNVMCLFPVLLMGMGAFYLGRALGMVGRRKGRK